MGETPEIPQGDGLNEKKEEDSSEMSVDEDESTESTESGDEDAEFNALDNQLNALSAALDNVEQKNDDIFEQLQKLLQSNREIRNQLAQTKNT